MMKELTLTFHVEDDGYDEDDLVEGIAVTAAKVWPVIKKVHQVEGYVIDHGVVYDAEEERSDE